MEGRRGRAVGYGALLVAALLVAASGRPADADAEAVAFAAEPGEGTGDPVRHLEQFVALSQPPEYRRLGSPGMAAAADAAASALVGAGYEVVRLDVPLTRWIPDYSPEHEPVLERVGDGTRFVVDAIFSTTVVTPPDGITCTVRMIADVQPGDCGFVPFDQASPEWNNLSERAGDAFEEIIAAGGVGAVVQGDPERDARIALRIRRALPGVMAVVDAGDVVGQVVHLRVVGADASVIGHEVIGVRRPADPSARSMLLQGHLDGWYHAAVDNGTGAAAVLAAAERLAADGYDGGLVVALHDGEEWGLLGSRALAEQLQSAAGLDVGDCGPALHLADIAGVVNLDASSARASDLQGPISSALGSDLPLFQWRVLVHSEEPVLTSVFLTSMFANAVLGLPVPVAAANELNGGVGRTDGKWFHEAGIPVVWPVAGYPEYHTEADTLEAVDTADLEALTAATVELLETVDPATIGPVLGASAPAPVPASTVECSRDAAVAGVADESPAGASPDAEVEAVGLPATGPSSAWPPAVGIALLGFALAVRRGVMGRSP